MFQKPDNYEWGNKKLFEPESIAMVGVSSEPTKMSHWLIRNIAGAGFRGAVYPISPKGGKNHRVQSVQTF